MCQCLDSLGFQVFADHPRHYHLIYIASSLPDSLTTLDYVMERDMIIGFQTKVARITTIWKPVTNRVDTFKLTFISMAEQLSVRESTTVKDSMGGLIHRVS